MALGKDELRRLKAYMRINELDGGEDCDDALIELMYNAAKEYLLNAGIKEPLKPKDDPEWQIIIYGLTLHFYDHRDSLDKPESELPLGLRRAMNQRKLTDGAI